MADTYAERGVSSGKEAVHAATAHLDKGLFPGAFCKILPDYVAGDPGYCVIMHSDGAGTKPSLAYLAQKYKVLPPEKIWGGIAQDSIVMNIDDAACAGALNEPMILTQTISRNPFRVKDADFAAIIAGAQQFCEHVNALGFTLVFASGETADVPDIVRTVDVSNTLFVRLKRSQVIDASRIKAGDVIIGFSSTGRALWEDEPNSGIGCNGLTNARHDTLSPIYKMVTESYAPELRDELVYRGEYRLEDEVVDERPGHERFLVAAALLSRTRTYLPLIRKIRSLPEAAEHLHGLIHCSGGGQTKIGKFGGPGLRYVKNNLFYVPPLFQMLQSSGKLPWRQMYSSYNMGHRLEAVVDRRFARDCLQASYEEGVEARVIGFVDLEGSDVPYNKVEIRTEYGTFTYPDDHP